MIIRSVNSRNYSAGFQTTPVAAIPDGLSKIKITFTREGWPDTGDLVLRVLIRVNADQEYLYGTACYGGDLINPITGLPQTDSWIEFLLPPGISRTATAEVEIFSAIRTGIVLEAT